MLSMGVILASVGCTVWSTTVINNACADDRCVLTPEQQTEFDARLKDLSFSGWNGAGFIAIRGLSFVLDAFSFGMFTRTLMKRVSPTEPAGPGPNSA